MQHKLEFVFVIDITSSRAMLKTAKKIMLEFGNNVKSLFEEHSSIVESMRYRIICYSDFSTYGEKAIAQTDFFAMPRDAEKFTEAVNGIKSEVATGICGNALEALFAAMRSDWADFDGGASVFTRQTIVLFTDKYHYEFGESDGGRGYNEYGFPPSMSELAALWSEPAPDVLPKFSPQNARLILFVPFAEKAGHSWNDVLCLENCIGINVTPEKAEIDGNSLDDIYGEILYGI